MEDYTVPIVAMNIAFRGGAAQDPEGKAGLANLMSGLLDEGAGDLDSRAFQAKLEDLSIELSFDAGSDAFYGSLRTLSTNAGRGLRALPPGGHRAALRRRAGRAHPRPGDSPICRQAESNPNEIVGAALGARRCSATIPMAGRTKARVESVATISADDLKAFHARTMARDNLHIVIVGAIDAAKAGAAIETMFGALPAHADAHAGRRDDRRRPARPSMRR